MKKQIVLITLASLFATSYGAQLDLQLKWDGHHEPVMKQVTRAPRPSSVANPMMDPAADSQEHIVTPAFQNPIHLADASVGSNPTFNMKSSGRYYLADDYRVAATTSGGALLGITADNVTLDLNSKVVVPSNSATQTTLVGINVAERDNVLIMNGTVQGLDSTGTQRLATGIDLGGSTSYSIKVRDVFVNRVTTTGISGSNLNDVSLERVSANNISGSATVNGVTLSSCSNVVIKDCEFNNNTTSADNCHGLNLSGCTNGVVENVMASSNTTTGTGADDVAIGVFVQSSTKNISFKNVVASNNSSTGAIAGYTEISCSGFEISASTLNTFESCVANGNTGENCAGFNCEGDVSNSVFKGCEASKNNSNAEGRSYGFRVNTASNNLLFDSCTANANDSDANAEAVYGFYLAVSNSKLENCRANKNTSAAFNVYGFYLTSGTNNHFLSCEAKGNETQTIDQSAIGFYSTSGTGNRWVKCVANGQKADDGTAGATTHYAAGFELNGETRSQIIECEAVGNNGQGTGSSARAYGVYLSGTAASCGVRDSYAAYNVTDAGLHFGFYDATATDTTTLFLSNISAGHGTSIGDTLDASFQFPETSGAATASLNYFFNHAGDGDNPGNIIHEVPRLNLTSLSTAVKLWENVSIY